MGRIAADTNDLRSGASTLRSTAGVYNDVSILVGNIVDPFALPASMRGQVSAYEAQIAGEARHLSSKVATEATALERSAVRFDRIDVLTGSGVTGGIWLSLNNTMTALGRMNRLQGFVKAVASTSGRTLRGAQSFKARSIAARILPGAGRGGKQLARFLRPANKFVKVPGLTFTLAYSANISKGQGETEAGMRAGGAEIGAKAGAVGGAVAGGVVVGALTGGLGAPVGAFVGGWVGSVGGAWVGDKVGGGIYGLFGRDNGPGGGGGGGGW